MIKFFPGDFITTTSGSGPGPLSPFEWLGLVISSDINGYNVMFLGPARRNLVLQGAQIGHYSYAVSWSWKKVP